MPERPIITLTTDFGTADFYVAAMKARLLQFCPDAQLIDVNEGRHVGALMVERSTAELFHLEDDIAGRVSYFLLAKSHPEDASVREFGAEATLAYLRARALLATRKITDADAAILEFTRAIAVAPAIVFWWCMKAVSMAASPVWLAAE